MGNCQAVQYGDTIILTLVYEGKSYRYEVAQDTRVAELKLAIVEDYGIPYECVSIRAGGAELRPEQTFYESILAGYNSFQLYDIRALQGNDLRTDFLMHSDQFPMLLPVQQPSSRLPSTNTNQTPPVPALNTSSGVSSHVAEASLPVPTSKGPASRFSSMRESGGTTDSTLSKSVNSNLSTGSRDGGAEDSPHREIRRLKADEPAPLEKRRMKLLNASVQERNEKLSKEVARLTDLLELDKSEKRKLENKIQLIRSELSETQAQMKEMTLRRIGNDNKMKGQSLLLKRVEDSLLLVAESSERRIADLRKLSALRLKRTEEELQKSFESQLSSMRSLNSQSIVLYQAEMKQRKQYFNELIELRGNIRILCRVRPLLPFETQLYGPTTAVTVTNGENIFDSKSTRKYQFENAFGPTSTQAEIFSELAPYIVSLLDGYNLCIFAYGQTGSGKTYTMQGTEQDPGLNLRAIQEILNKAKESKTQMQYSYAVSVVEVYNDYVYDLSVSGRESLSIRDIKGDVTIDGLSKIPIRTYEEMRMVLRRAFENRTTRSHMLNISSSRSHLVVSLYVTGRNIVDSSVIKGTLNLIDLAGSERLSKTETIGDGVTEAKYINKSVLFSSLGSAFSPQLSALGNVIQARLSKDAHVPYRDSKLTHILKNMLDGDSKVIMIVNVSPCVSNTQESSCSLVFAQRCHAVELGRAKKNVVSKAAPHRASPPPSPSTFTAFAEGSPQKTPVAPAAADAGVLRGRLKKGRRKVTRRKSVGGITGRGRAMGPQSLQSAPEVPVPPSSGWNAASLPGEWPEDREVDPPSPSAWRETGETITSAPPRYQDGGRQKVTKRKVLRKRTVHAAPGRRAPVPGA